MGKGEFDFCVHCGRRLQSAESRRRGMGTKCATWCKTNAPQLLRIIERARQPELLAEETVRTP